MKLVEYIELKKQTNQRIVIELASKRDPSSLTLSGLSFFFDIGYHSIRESVIRVLQENGDIQPGRSRAFTAIQLLQMRKSNRTSVSNRPSNL